MNANRTVSSKMDTRVLLSTLWIVVMINMLMADVLSLFVPGAMDELVRSAGETPIAQLMLGAAIIMEIAIAMIILARVLPHRVNRWANIITSLLMIVFVIAGGSSYPHYIFIASVEVICLLLIIWNAWKWTGAEAWDSHESAARATSPHAPSV